MRQKIAALLVLASAFGLTVPSASAQVLVATVRSTNDVIDVVKHVATLAGRDDIANQIEPFLDTLTDGQGLIGLDRKAPLGFYVQEITLPGQPPKAAVFLPVTAEDGFVKLLQALNAEVKKPDQGGVREVTLATGQTVYLRFLHRHAFIGLDRDYLASALPDPKRLVSEESRQYMMHVALRARAIPPAVRKKLLALLQQALSLPIERKPDETEAGYQARRFLLQLGRQQVLQLAQDLDEVSLQMDIDTTKHQLTVALDVTMRPGSATATALRPLQQRPSRFRALQSPSGSGLIIAYPVEGPLRALLDQVTAGIEKGIAQKPKEQQALLRKLYEAIRPTLKGDVLELAVFLHGPASDGKLTPLVAVRLHDGGKLETAFRQLVQALPEDAKSRIRLDSAQLAGHKAHEILITPDDPNFAQIFGEEKLLLLVADEYLLLSAGTHSREVLQQAVGKIREQPGPPAILEISMRQIAVLAQTNPQSKRFAEAVQRTFTGPNENRDRLRVVQEIKDHRLHFRLEVPTLVFRVAILANQ